jgi:hypothetical protein
VTLDDTWSWDSDTCDYEGCTELATQRLYVGDELRRHYCELHMNEVANEHARFWQDVIGTAAAAEAALPPLNENPHPRRS